MSRKQRQSRRVPSPPRYWWLLGILTVFGVVAYWNSFEAPFVFDDLLSVQLNTGVRFGEFAFNFLSARSLLYLTFTLNHVWSQQDVWSYHLVNLLLHLINGALVLFVAARIFERIGLDTRQSRIYGWMAATFFVAHPVQTESVTYISSRSELLSTSFFLIAFLLFVACAARRIGFLFSLLVAVPFYFGLSSKETVITLPAVIFLYDFLFLSGGRFRPMLERWRFYITFIVGGMAAVYYIAIALRQSIGPNLQGHLSISSYFLTQLRVLVRYVYLIFCPVGLNVDYDFRPSVSPFQPAVIASFLLLSAILALGWMMRKKRPVFSFSILSFFVILLPTSSVVPILDVIFEHRLYLPLFGVCLSFPGFIELVSDRLRRHVGIDVRASAASVVLLVLLTAGSVMRNHVWADDIRLYSDIIAKSPLKQRGYNTLSLAYYKRGDYANAIAIIEKGIKAVPGGRRIFAQTLGNLYLKTGRYDDAIELFREVTAALVKPQEGAVAYNNLGVAHLYKWNALKARSAQMSSGAFHEEKLRILGPASEAFAKAVEIDPDEFFAFDSYVNVAYDLGDADSLEASLLEKLKTDPAFNDLYGVGKIAFLRAVPLLDQLSAGGLNEADAASARQRMVNHFSRADEFFERAEKVKPTVKLLYFNHGYTLYSINQADRAIEKYLQAIRLDPIFIEARHNVAQVYMSKGDYASAIEHFSEVLRWEPKHVSTHVNLAKIYGVRNDKESARKHLNIVLGASPGNASAMQTWRQLGL